jgi:2Fe-2S ferredoxin
LINISVKDLDGQVHEVKAQEGDSLMESLNDYEWGLAGICGGLCSCGTCHVYLDKEWLDQFQQVDADEQDLLDSFDGIKNNSRLGCQLVLQEKHDGLKLTIALDE